MTRLDDRAESWPSDRVSRLQGKVLGWARVLCARMNVLAAGRGSVESMKTLSLGNTL
jgi:hypothetical protein